MLKKWYAKINGSAYGKPVEWIRIGIIKRDDELYDLIADNGDDVSNYRGYYSIESALNAIDIQWRGRDWNLTFI